MGTDQKSPKATSEVDELSAIMSEIDQLHHEMHEEEGSNVLPFTGVTSSEAASESVEPMEPAEPSPERTPLSLLDELAEGASDSVPDDAPSEISGLESRMLEETIAAQARAAAPKRAPVVHAPVPRSGADEEGTLTMSLTGNMKLNLRYDFQDWQVQIGFTEEALQVKLSDGTEFKIPVRSKIHSA